MSTKSEVLQLPQLSINPETWDSDMQKLMSHIRPQWQWDQVKQKMFTDGITNKLAAMHLGSMTPGADVVLVRVYGEKTDLIIDRTAEVRNMQLLHSKDLAPRLYAQFSNGLCYAYIAGNVADEETVRNPETSRLIARELAMLHAIDVGDDYAAQREAGVWATMRRWLELGPDAFDEPDRERRLKAELPDKKGLLAEIELLESRLGKSNCPIVFSHNDTLIKNFVHCPHEDRVRLIDYEYCSFNYLPFDIGNHFNEFAGVDVVDHAKYPRREFQLPWLRNYLRYRDEIVGADGGDLDARVGELYVLVNQFSLVSHLFWSLWALVQARHSTIEFDFLDYGISRFCEYRDKREERLAITAD